MNGALVGAAVLFALLLLVERFAAEPVLPLSLFRNQVFASAGVLSVGVGAVILSLAYYLPLFLQGVVGESATNSDVVLTPMTVSIVVGSMLSGFLVARTGRYHLFSIVAAVVMSAAIFLLSRMTETMTILQATLCFGLVMIVAALFLKDVPLRARWAAEPHESASAAPTSTAVAPVAQTTGEGDRREIEGAAISRG